MGTIESYRKWRGTADELAEVAADVLRSLGMPEDLYPSIRVVRDYAQKGILSPADRGAKEEGYGFQHLKELVAARVLLSEGMPLAKIAEQFERDRDIVILPLGLGHAIHSSRPNAAEERWRQMRGQPPQAGPAGVSSEYWGRTMEGTGIRLDLQRTLRRLGAAEGEPDREALVRIKLVDWCSLLIETRRLRNLSLEQAEDIGRAVTAILSDPRVRKGDYDE